MSVAEVCLGDLETALRDVVLDSVLEGADLPMLLVDERVASAGSVDVEAMIEAVRALRP